MRRRVGYRGDGDPAGGGLLQLGGAGAETMAGRAAEAGLPNEFAAFLAQQRRLAGVPFSGEARSCQFRGQIMPRITQCLGEFTLESKRRTMGYNDGIYDSQDPR